MKVVEVGSAEHESCVATCCVYILVYYSTRLRRIYPGRESIARVEGIYTRDASQSRASRENIPGTRANHAHRGRIYPGREPIARIEGEYTRDVSQSRASDANVVKY
eukprot:1189779-Prorocentrum_minimum.AAC.2